MAVEGTFRAGMRCIVHKHWSTVYYEVMVVELSPSGKLMKTEPGGWVSVDEWCLEEELVPLETRSKSG